MAKIYFAWVEDLYVAFDPAVHAIVAEPGVDEQMHTIRLSQKENAAAIAEITFPNPGVGLLSASRRRFVLISESETEDPADAILQARGRITALPTELQSLMITVEAICGPEDLEDRQRAKAAELYEPPWTDRLFGDKPDDILAALNARGVTWYIDPVTHDVSVTDILKGVRVVDIGVDHALADFVIKPGEAPVRKAKMQVVMEWEQSAAVTVDISDSIPHIDTLTAVDASLGNLDASNPLAPAFTPDAGIFPDVTINTGAGWEMGANGYRRISQAPVMIDRGNERTRMHEGYSYTGAAWNRTVFEDGTWQHYYRYNYARLADATERLVRLDGCQCDRFKFDHFRVSCNYRQQRRETIELTMELPVQDVLGAVAELDMGTLVLDDPTDDLDTPVWYPGMEVTAGEHVQFDGQRWLVTETHSREYFYFRSVINGVLVSVTTPGFAPAAEIAALDRASPKFVGLPRGDAAVEHALMLMEAALRWRLRGLGVTVRPGDWATVRDLTLEDELRCHHPRFGDIQGKVIGWTRIWAGSGRYATVDLGVPLGTGATGVRDVGDVDYTVTAQAVAEPVVASALGNRMYAVTGVDIANDAEAQAVLAGQAVNDGLDPAGVIANNPTTVAVTLRDLTTVRVIDRKIAVEATVLDSPKGFDTGV
jgi:hypothetical protein